MGFFSGKTVSAVGTSAVKLIDQDEDIIKDATEYAVLRNADIAASIVQTVVGGFNVAVDDYYRYGKTNYTNGLPEGYQSFIKVNVADVKAVLDGLEGAPTTVSSANTGFTQALEFAKEYCQDNQGWDFTTNEVTSPPFTSDEPVYLHSATSSGSTLSITYEYEDDLGDGLETVQATHNFTVAKLKDDGIYYYVNYSLDSAPADLIIWIYDTSSATHPTLQAPNPLAYGTPFYPVVPLVESGAFLDDRVDSDPLKTTAKVMCKKLSMGLSSMSDELKTNPDLDKIDDVFIVLGIDIQSQTAEGLPFLYEFFDTAWANADVTKLEFDAWDSATLTEAPVNEIYVNDNAFNATIGFHYIEKTVVLGVIGVPGVITSSTVTATSSVYTYPEGSISKGTYAYVDNSTLTLRKQINLTQYEELIIYGPTHTTDVYEGEIVLKNLVTSLTISDEGNPDRGFFIPLDSNIAGALSPKRRSELYKESILLLVYARDTQHLDWYETPEFFFYLKVALIVISFITLQPQFALLAEATTLYAALLILGEIVLTNLIIQYTVELLAEEIGAENTAILATILLVASIASGTNLLPDVINISAEALLFGATALFNGAQAALKQDFAELQEEERLFLEEAEEAQAELDSALESLGDYGDPFTSITPVAYNNPNESPEDYYARVNNTNPGVMVLDIPDTFYDAATTLPEPQTDILLYS